MQAYMLELAPISRHPDGALARNLGGTFFSPEDADRAGRAAGGRFVVHPFWIGATEAALNTPALNRQRPSKGPDPRLL